MKTRDEKRRFVLPKRRLWILILQERSPQISCSWKIAVLAYRTVPVAVFIDVGLDHLFKLLLGVVSTSGYSRASITVEGVTLIQERSSKKHGGSVWTDTEGKQSESHSTHSLHSLHASRKILQWTFPNPNTCSKDSKLCLISLHGALGPVVACRSPIGTQSLENSRCLKGPLESSVRC